MLIPLVERLRCPTPHAETWLVASIDRAIERDILEGTLGCPTCMREYAVRDGIVYFDEHVMRGDSATPAEHEAIRLAAALELTDPRMVAVLHAGWGAHAMILRGLAPVPLLLVNPPRGVTSGDGISIIVTSSRGLAHASFDAVAVGAGASDDMLASLRGALRPGKRMLAPVSTPLPADCTELARDDEIWVAQLDAQAATSAPIMPARRAR